ncbi:hypothetical protein GS399_04905 [Pedobacter sp. HMF7647]|uniref:Uncharacterized protein n=1 Tax=Hufsiella arboris TaxID=2695275 RepID=A0A7K1Y6U9_9SPHI|nr:DUF6790 family protein [Hufsiella arboris]MXV50302.1 hypothetical protein [Hufsiella arboris]
MTEQFIKAALTNFTITFFAIGLLCALIKIYRYRRELSPGFVIESIFSNYCFWALGITSIYNAIMHIVFHKMAAHFIGWPDNPFQLEVGFASLGLGIAGILAFHNDFGLRLGLITVLSIFLWGSAAGHIFQLIKFQNYAPGNAGIMLWTGLLQPLVNLLLFYLSIKFPYNEQSYEHRLVKPFKAPVTRSGWRL